MQFAMMEAAYGDGVLVADFAVERARLSKANGVRFGGRAAADDAGLSSDEFAVILVKGGHKALIKWLAETPLYRVVFEPTGPYHGAFQRALGAASVPFVKVNPRQARRFAEATGKLAKTDRLDAAILARMGALVELEARPARSELLFELKELYVAREALVKDRTAAKNRGKDLTLSLLKRQNGQRREQIDRQIATVEAAIRQLIEANASLADRFAILTCIPGVSNVAREERRRLIGARVRISWEREVWRLLLPPASRRQGRAKSSPSRPGAFGSCSRRRRRWRWRRRHGRP